MLNLDGVLGFDKVREVNTYTTQRFKNKAALKTPEALSLYEMKYLDDDQIKELCEKAYGHKLYCPIKSYVPEMLVTAFQGTGYVPIIYEPMGKRVTVVYLDDLDRMQNVSYPDHQVITIPTTIYYYLEAYAEYYGVHSILNDMPAKTLFDGIVNEAIELGAADITISTVGMSTQVYYNARKKRVDSRKVFNYEFMMDVIHLLTISSPYDFNSGKPKDCDVDLNKEYRGRVQINPKAKSGYTITIRLLPNIAFNAELEQLNLSKVDIDFLTGAFLDRTPGLKLIVGATMSGKNTTILAVLNMLAKEKKYKIVSVEQPVEQALPGIEQISVEKEEEFDANIRSLIKVNPDIVYVTEIRDSTGLSVLQITNTGKVVFSTLHSNGVAETITRLVDITGQSQDRVIMALHSICYQELVRDEATDRVYPKMRFVRFTDELKYRLYGKPLGEVLKIIKDVEGGD